LEAIASDQGNVYAAKALATLAFDDLQQGRPAVARARFRQFLERYPRSEYAWLATLHAAEALANGGDWSAAEREFVAAAATYHKTTTAVILGHVLAAHAAEAAGQPARALVHYTDALAVWPRETYVVSLYTTQKEPQFRRNDVAQRSGLLRASLARPGGDLLERGRWQLANGQQPAAIATLEDVLTRFPVSPLRPEATVLLHRAQLEAALDLANIERPDADAPTAALRIEELASQPLDAATVAARIARASQLWTRGDADAARSAMTAALAEWTKAQPHDPAPTDIAADVAAIRDVVFRPLGGGIYAERPGWNAFEWPKSLPRFLLVDPELVVKLSSGDDTTISVTRPLTDYPNVVFSDKTMIGLLDRTLVALGGTKRRQPTQIMETPNQPVGASMNILTLWNEFFPARPGHWGGYEFTSYPRITRIQFLDAARTRAAADVTIGYSGATVVLEKRGTTWTPVKLTNEWIT
jgi:tetratricopeptide (TPR) repeat protein